MPIFNGLLDVTQRRHAKRRGAGSFANQESAMLEHGAAPAARVADPAAPRPAAQWKERQSQALFKLDAEWMVTLSQWEATLSNAKLFPQASASMVRQMEDRKTQDFRDYKENRQRIIAAFAQHAPALAPSATPLVAGLG